MATAGYSGTPLPKKLGIKAGDTILPLGAPAGYPALLGLLPVGVRFASRAGAAVDLVHLFSTRATDLERRLAALRPRLRAEVPIWVSWPKRASGLPTDITEDTIRDVALPMGLVDIKVCAVDDTWSGLKLVVRRELR